MATERLAALKQAKAEEGALDTLDFIVEDKPRCPHCGEQTDISENELFFLYEEGDHDVTCPSCELEYHVVVRATYNFSTDEQPEEDDDDSDDE